MIDRLRKNFSLQEDAENFQVVIESIAKNVVFRGTNLWILVFAIFIACLGLNINSTAVIIGAMLISPLMGPIMGIGLGLGINDLELVKKSVKHYMFAIIVGLTTSALYFLITPLQEAHSEILARTTPTIFDVLIALFGGLAGMIAISSKMKGNVIPGVAIATALMPPLCTAGYGVATLNVQFVISALYLLTINTVFIALATLITVKFLRFPVLHLKNAKEDIHSRRIISLVTILTLIPSIYLGYKMIGENRFTRNAEMYVTSVNSFEGNYLLKKEIDATNRLIVLTYGGKDFNKTQLEDLKKRLIQFQLSNANLDVRQGLSLSNPTAKSENTIQLSSLLYQKEFENIELRRQLNSKLIVDSLQSLLFNEIKSINKSIEELVLKGNYPTTDSTASNRIIAIVFSPNQLSSNIKKRINDYLTARLQPANCVIIYSNKNSKSL